MSVTTSESTWQGRSNKNIEKETLHLYKIKSRSGITYLPIFEMLKSTIIQYTLEDTLWGLCKLRHKYVFCKLKKISQYKFFGKVNLSR